MEGTVSPKVTEAGGLARVYTVAVPCHHWMPRLLATA
jgi:hypothetical protein